MYAARPGLPCNLRRCLEVEYGAACCGLHRASGDHLVTFVLGLAGFLSEECGIHMCTRCVSSCIIGFRAGFLTGGNLRMLGAALVAIFAALAWTLGNMVPFFYLSLIHISEPTRPY